MMARLPQPDFLRPARRAGGLAWAWCATGLLVLAAAGLEAADTWQQRQQTLQRLDLALRPLPPPPAPAAFPSQPPSRPPGLGASPADAAAPATQARDAQAARWLQRLALPWPGVFAAAETVAVDGTQFTGLSFDGQGQLRLEGQALQAEAALAAADALRGAAAGIGPWQDVTLARLDRAADGRRFEIVARLAAPVSR